MPQLITVFQYDMVWWFSINGQSRFRPSPELLPLVTASSV